jgi:hypothetical protein
VLTVPFPLRFLFAAYPKLMGRLIPIWRTLHKQAAAEIHAAKNHLASAPSPVT